jgi:hypothetical protein
MHTALWVFLAAAIGIILFFSIQDQLPDELAFLRDAGQPTERIAPDGTRIQVQTHLGWEIRTSASAVEIASPLTRAAAGAPAPGLPSGQELGILCHGGRLDMRLDARSQTTGVRQTPVVVSGLGEIAFDKGTGTNIFPPHPQQLLRHLVQADDAVTFTVEYAAHGKAVLVLRPRGLAELARQLPPSCQ